LQIDDGINGEFVEVVGYTKFYTLTSVVVMTNIQSGLSYRLRYRAHNVHGWGPFSPVSQVLAATIPGVTEEPKTII